MQYLDLKNDRMISIRFQVKPFSYHSNPIYAPTSNAEEAEVQQFYEDLQDLLEIIIRYLRDKLVVRKPASLPIGKNSRKTALALFRSLLKVL